ncbi:MAG: hypothetical protein ACE5JP_01455 [Candidatus Bipolaricaulia bacterium]
MLKEQALRKLVREVTGKEHVEDGLGILLKSYLKQKIAEYRRQIAQLEREYGMEFEKYEKKLGEKLPLTWKHEQDYMAWEEAVINLRYFEQVIEQLSTHA